MVTAPGSGAEIIPFLKTWVNLPMAIGFTVLYTKVRRQQRQQARETAAHAPALARGGAAPGGAMCASPHRPAACPPLQPGAAPTLCAMSTCACTHPCSCTLLAHSILTLVLPLPPPRSCPT